MRRLLRRLSPTRLGLRARITFAFALSALALSAVMGGTTWGLTRQNLVSQREASVTRQAFLNARTLQGGLPADTSELTSDDVRARLAGLASPTGSRPILRIVDSSGEPRGTGLVPQFGENALPPAFRRQVNDGVASTMRYNLSGETELAVGIPLAEANATYYEIVSLDDLDQTLDSLGVSLAGAALVTTVAGALGGYLTSRRTLRPLGSVGRAAEAIAGGRLDTRLEPTRDPDLTPLVSSFNHMAEALEDRIERDARFASDVSHELRSPLMTLSASVQVLNARRDEMPDDAARSAAELMTADVARFQQLIDDLLEISRFDAGVARLAIDDVRIDQLVGQAVHLYAEGEVPIEVIVDGEGMVDVESDHADDDEEDRLVLRADKRRLMRVVANLLTNADKYAGGATGVVVERRDDVVRITIADDGPGIDEEERRRIFERFNRGAGAGRRGGGADGVGLGLSLVAEHVGLHHGRVWVEDPPDGDRGARFVVELPVSARS